MALASLGQRTYARQEVPVTVLQEVPVTVLQEVPVTVLQEVPVTFFSLWGSNGNGMTRSGRLAQCIDRAHVGDSIFRRVPRGSVR